MQGWFKFPTFSAEYFLCRFFNKCDEAESSMWRRDVGDGEVRIGDIEMEENFFEGVDEDRFWRLTVRVTKEIMKRFILWRLRQGVSSRL